MNLALTGLLIKLPTPFKQILPIPILCTVHKQTLSLTFVLFHWLSVYMSVYSRSFLLYLYIQIFAALKMMHTSWRIVGRWCMMKLLVERVLISENPSGDFNDERHFSSSWHLLSHVQCTHEVITCTFTINCFSGILLKYRWFWKLYQNPSVLFCYNCILSKYDACITWLYVHPLHAFSFY